MFFIAQMVQKRFHEDTLDSGWLVSESVSSSSSVLTFQSFCIDVHREARRVSQEVSLSGMGVRVRFEKDRIGLGLITLVGQLYLTDDRKHSCAIAPARAGS